MLAIASHLTDRNGLVRRYLGDEIEEAEGAFLLCTFWLAHALALTGHVVQARKVFQTALAHAQNAVIHRWWDFRSWPGVPLASGPPKRGITATGRTFAASDFIVPSFSRLEGYVLNAISALRRS
nr:hypothetical protein [Streptomyces sp. GbtcB7]